MREPTGAQRATSFEYSPASRARNPSHNEKYSNTQESQIYIYLQPYPFVLYYKFRDSKSDQISEFVIEIFLDKVELF